MLLLTIIKDMPYIPGTTNLLQQHSTDLPIGGDPRIQTQVFLDCSQIYWPPLPLTSSFNQNVLSWLQGCCLHILRHINYPQTAGFDRTLSPENHCNAFNWQWARHSHHLQQQLDLGTAQVWDSKFRKCWLFFYCLISSKWVFQSLIRNISTLLGM